MITYGIFFNVYNHENNELIILVNNLQWYIKHIPITLCILYNDINKSHQYIESKPFRTLGSLLNKPAVGVTLGVRVVWMAV